MWSMLGKHVFSNYGVRHAHTVWGSVKVQVVCIDRLKHFRTARNTCFSFAKYKFNYGDMGEGVK